MSFYEEFVSEQKIVRRKIALFDFGETLQINIVDPDDPAILRIKREEAAWLIDALQKALSEVKPV